MPTPATRTQSPHPTIALIGRVNVGKSTLFNRLIEKSHALVNPEAGTTRTRNIAEGIWRGTPLRFIDTGGFVHAASTELDRAIAAQTNLAIQEADLILLIVDGEVGILPPDKEVAEKCVASGLPILLVVNKIDNERKEHAAHRYPWARLGLSTPIFVSGINGRNTHELLDAVFSRVTTLPAKIGTPPPAETITIAVIGRPNVGKSSLFNALIGVESAIVSPIPHTTREPFDTEVFWDSSAFVFVDTAGIRRKALIKKGLEYGGVQKSIEALKHAEVALLVLEHGVPVLTQDKHLAGLIRDAGKSCIIVVNKCDHPHEHDQAAMKLIEKQVQDAIPFLSYAPIILVSAKTKSKIHKLFPLIRQVYRSRHIFIEEAILAAFLKEVTAHHLPSRGRGTRHPALLSLRQRDTDPPIFEVTIKYKTSLHESYLHYLENRLRQQFGFTGTPLIIKMKKGR